jgi:hypothetical protein
MDREFSPRSYRESQDLVLPSGSKAGAALSWCGPPAIAIRVFGTLALQRLQDRASVGVFQAWRGIQG